MSSDTVSITILSDSEQTFIAQLKFIYNIFINPYLQQPDHGSVVRRSDSGINWIVVFLTVVRMLNKNA